MTQTIITAGDAAAGTVVSSGNDGTLVLQSGPAGGKVNALSFAADGTPMLLKVPAVTAVQSMVRVNTAAGFGSTNNSVRRYTNSTNGVNGAVIQGTDITYAGSATLGDTFTVNTAGVYAISVSDNWTAANTMAISQNAPNLVGVTIAAQPPLNILVVGVGAAANFSGTCSWTGYLAVGTIIRILVDGSGASVNGTAAPAQFTMTRTA